MRVTKTAVIQAASDIADEKGFKQCFPQGGC